MAAHYVAIAKASFAAGLLRPDPASVSREEIGRFHTLLDETLQKCSVPNVQKCKTWLVENVVPSSARTTAFGKYLAALSTSLENDGDDSTALANGPRKVKTLTARKRLHIVYLLNDILHDAKYHQGLRPVHASLSSNLQPQLVSIFSSAAAYDADKYPKQHRRLKELLAIWKENGYYSEQYIQKLVETVANGGAIAMQKQSRLGEGEGSQGHQSNTPQSQQSKGVPFVMPASHGDQSTPYYDLPAGNLMPHIIPNSTAPINPQLVKPLQFVAGPADQSLVTAVKDLLNDVHAIYNSNLNDDFIDIDEMGQPMVRDEATGEPRACEGYYGWSIEFCERMRTRKKGKTMANSDKNERGRSRSRGRSSSYSRSITPRKRRHDSASTNGRRSRSRPRRSRSRSRTDSRDSRFSRTPPRRARRSRSRSHDRLRQSNKRARSQTRSKNASEGPINTFPPFTQGAQASTHFTAPSAPMPMDHFSDPFSTGSVPVPLHPQPGQYQSNFPMGRTGVPIPPPPPPFHVGTWPPPPPPLPTNMPPTMPANLAQQFAAFASMAQQVSPSPQHSNWPGQNMPNFNQTNNGASQSQPNSMGHVQNQTWEGSNSNWNNGQDPRRR